MLAFEIFPSLTQNRDLFSKFSEFLNLQDLNFACMVNHSISFLELSRGRVENLADIRLIFSSLPERNFHSSDLIL